MTPDPLDLLRSKLDRVKDKPSGGFIARCPAHDDQHASLSVDVGRDDRALVKCFAGCENEAIVEALGLTLGDLFPPRDEPPPNITRRIATTYDYTDATGTLLFQVVRFEPKDFRQRRPDGNGGWIYNLTGVQPALYRLPDLIRAKSDEPVLIVEGEKDCDNLRRHGFVATTHAGGTGNSRKMLPLYVETLAGRHVVIAPDNDPPGIASAHAIATALHGHAASVKALALAGLPEKGDVSDWMQTRSPDELRAKIEATKLWQPSTSSESSDPMPPVPQATVKLVRLDAVEEREIDWLWKGWLARQELSLHVGHPGLGKSTLSLALTAAFSTGGALPDGTQAPETSVLLMLAEDSLSTTIAKGLRLHGANRERVYFAQVVVDQQGMERGIDLGRHLPEIERIVTENDIGLVIIDPLSGFTPGKDRNSEGDTRDVLTPLRQLAERHNFAALGVAHFGKPSGAQRTALQGVLGSTGIVALARTVIASVELPEASQPEDADLETGLVRLTGVIKSNLDVKPPAVTWRRPRDSAIRWLGKSNLSVEDILAAPRERGTSSLDQAKAFIEDELHGGSKPATEIEAAAKAQQISHITLKRAKRELNVTSIKLPNQNGGWLWQLPATERTPNRAPEAPDIEGDHPAGEGDHASQADQMIPFDQSTSQPEGDQGNHMIPLAYLRQNVANAANDTETLTEEKKSKGINMPYRDSLIPFESDEPAAANGRRHLRI